MRKRARCFYFCISDSPFAFNIFWDGKYWPASTLCSRVQLFYYCILVILHTGCQVLTRYNLWIISATLAEHFHLLSFNPTQWRIYRWGARVAFPPSPAFSDCILKNVLKRLSKGHHPNKSTQIFLAFPQSELSRSATAFYVVFDCMLSPCMTYVSYYMFKTFCFVLISLC